MLKKIKRIYKKIFNRVDGTCTKLFWFLCKVLLALAIDLVLVFIAAYITWYYFTMDGMIYRVQKIYHQLVIETGQTQDALPLQIVNSPIDNAYNDGTKIVIYTGIIDHTQSMDEVALVLGHEIAHGMLGHLNPALGRLSDEEVQELEANADKLGAVYMMKAGYNICKGRELFRHWRTNNGDYLGGNHPNYSYRIDELDIDCD